MQTYGELRSRYKILVGKPEAKRPLGTEIGCEDVNYIQLALDRSSGGFLWAR